MTDSANKQWDVQRHWHNFITSSSVRGLKRTQTSETLFLRLFWAFFLVGSLAMMVVQIHSVVHTYVSQKDSTAMQSKRLNSQVKFPAISMCREASYNSAEEVTRAMVRHNASVTTPQSYSRKIADMLYKMYNNATSIRRENMGLALMAIGIFDTVVGYQAQVPRNAIEEVALPMTKRLVYAQAFFDNGSSVILVHNTALVADLGAIKLPETVGQIQQLKNSFEIKNFYHYQHFLCQTLQLGLSDIDQSHTSSIALLFWHPSTIFDTANNSTNDRAFATNGFWTADAIRMALHPVGQHGKVHVDNNGMLVQSGGYTEARFSPRVTKYLDCSEQKLLHGDQGDYNYNLNDCKYLKYDEELRRICNCTLDPFAWNYSQCLRMNWNDLQLSDWGYCMGILEWNKAACGRPACVETDFLFDHSFSEWKINDFQWKWVVDLLITSEVSLKKYLTLSQMDDAANTEELKRSILSFDMLKNSLTSVRICRQSGITLYQEEVKLTSLANLFSSCGGAMSLFMGITLTLLAEFIEFLYHVCRRDHEMRQPHPADDWNKGSTNAQNGTTLEKVEDLEVETP